MTHYTLAFLEGLKDVDANKLKKMGITSVEEYLTKCQTPTLRRHLAQECGMDEKVVLRLANQADLMRIHGIGKEYAELLESAGVDTVPELAQRNAANLHEKVLETNDGEMHSHTLRTPALSEIERWIEEAKQLPRMLEY